MIARQLIADTIPSLSLKDTANTALELMQEFGLDMMPVEDDDHKYAGLLTDEAIMDIEDMNKPLSELPFSLIHPYANENMHIFEVIKITAENNLTLIPVVEKDDRLVGTITLKSLFRYFAQYNSLLDNGAILIVETNLNSYSLSEIARIVESNNIKVLCLYVNTVYDTSKVEITLKLDKYELSSLVQTFERFNYTIKATYEEREYFQDLKEKYDEFMKYMDI
ncbi:MAG: CBS domain-containing protein [Bacteroidota bacterium]